MKTKKLLLCLSIFYIVSCSSGSKPKEEVKNNDTLVQEEVKLLAVNETVMVHTMKKKDNTFIGDVYATFINDSIFTHLYVINESDTIYRIEETMLSNLKGKEVEVYSDGFWGYKFIIQRDDYFVLLNYGNYGVNVSDDIIIEWNYDDTILEIQKVP